MEWWIYRMFESVSDLYLYILHNRWKLIMYVTHQLKPNHLSLLVLTEIECWNRYFINIQIQLNLGIPRSSVLTILILEKAIRDWGSPRIFLTIRGASEKHNYILINLFANIWLKRPDMLIKIIFIHGMETANAKWMKFGARKISIKLGSNLSFNLAESL